MGAMGLRYVNLELVGQASWGKSSAAHYSSIRHAAW